ncbi:TonB-dependent receptor [Fusobacterium varium]|uniref:TonB-dependent receptor n=1 Tax=Fusobacterium varium TaxID=856 RepID=UPI001F269AE0|nr:TonB-dependent receptor [Fusobacterium varium]MCF2672106.1 TonB-dependent receptor [Fusobacterium varium]
MKKYLMVVAVLAVSSSVMAANEEKFAVKLDETIVSAESFGTSVLETPKNVTVITSEDIERRGAQTIEEAIKGVPGMTTFSNIGGDDPKVSFRGMAPGKENQNILVLLNGVPYNSLVDTAGFNFNLIPIGTVERIEVVPNGGNVLYGEGAVAGVINIITKEGKDKKYYGTVGFETGSYSLRNYTVNAGTQITDRLSANINYVNKNVDNYRKHDSRDIEYVDINTKYKLDNGTLSFGYSHSEVESYFPGEIVSKDDVKKPYTSLTEGKETVKTYKLNYETKLSDNLEFMFTGNYRDKLYESTGFKSGAKPPRRGPSSLRDTQSLYLSSQIKYQYMESSHIIIGGDYSDGDSKYRYYNSKNIGAIDTSTDTDRKSFGAFAINSMKINNFIFTQGYRHQRMKYDVTDNKTTKYNFNKTYNEDAFELTGNYLINESSSVYLTYNRAFRAPTVDEVGYWNKNVRDIEVQTSDTFELGTKSLWNNFYFSGAVFQTRTENEIFYTRYEDELTAPASGNYNLPGKNIRRGIELTMEQYFDKLTLRESFSYIYHEIDSGVFKGKDIPGVPNYIYNLGLDYSILDNLTFNTSFYYYGSAYASSDFDNSFGKQDGHTELNMSLNYQMQNGLTIYGGVNNLLNEEYFNAKVSGTKLKYYYGTRRNYYVGFKYSF